jgi:hypothetical protein
MSFSVLRDHSETKPPFHLDADGLAGHITTSRWVNEDAIRSIARSVGRSVGRDDQMWCAALWVFGRRHSRLAVELTVGLRP